MGLVTDKKQVELASLNKSSSELETELEFVSDL
jgi:hypothetical protein